LRYFLPDWDDRVDPNFDFEFELSTVGRDPWKDDLYAHEFFGEDPCYDGILVSRAALERNRAKRDQVNRFGLRRYLRLPKYLELIGDCGAFDYVNDPVPRYQTPEMLNFYQRVAVNYGVSIDHIIFPSFPEQREQRYSITVSNAIAFLQQHRTGRYSFTPVGAIQGWDTASYSQAAKALIAAGYDMLAIGGLVRARTEEVLSIVRAVSSTVGPAIRLHLLGVAREDILVDLLRLGVFSFDSASPMRTSWMSASKNYLAGGTSYTAIRIPYARPDTRGVRSDNILSRSRSDTTFDAMQTLETCALQATRSYARGHNSLDAAMAAIEAYDMEQTRDTDNGSSRALRMANYRRTLKDRPWTNCDCAVCKQAGVEVVIFRGNNRNRRRGFHNVRDFYKRLRDLHRDWRDRPAQMALESLARDGG
jgi:hypothetical protein